MIQKIFRKTISTFELIAVYSNGITMRCSDGSEIFIRVGDKLNADARIAFNVASCDRCAEMIVDAMRRSGYAEENPTPTFSDLRGN